jgi:hypothetical protein
MLKVTYLFFHMISKESVNMTVSEFKTKNTVLRKIL